ncbi:ABC transporter ATP-binding protein [Salininema proteolyticum]|uniref:ABC transporter ATP-binding protein n=1 Tax=Salininema proteolyticum TaxID=1607685 RepID=A0ABV8TWW0_9ACTN
MSSPRRTPDSLRGIAAIFHLSWQNKPGQAAAWFALLFASAAFPFGLVLVGGTLLGSLPAAAEAGLDSPEAQRTYVYIGLFAALTLGTRFSQNFCLALSHNVGRDLQLHLQNRLLNVLARPAGIAHYDRPDILDRLRVTRNLGVDQMRPERAVEGIGQVFPNVLASLGACLLIGLFSPWLGLAWLIGWPLMFYLFMMEYARIGRLVYAGSTDLRETEYLRDIAISEEPAKEVRIWGLRRRLLERFDAGWARSIDTGQAGMRPGRLAIALAIVLALFGTTATLLAYQGLSGTVAAATIGISLLAVRSLSELNAFDDSTAFVVFGAVPVPKVTDLDDDLREEEPPAPVALAPEAPEGDVTFKGVTFAYPGAEDHVLEDFDLTIDAGTSLAVVGHNGAGKTSLVKLLSGFYAPDSGAITADGIDIADLRPAEWRSRLSALYQDFTRYPLTVRDNITLGAPEFADHDDKIRAACRHLDVQELVDSLPRGLDTVLSAEYEGGVDLSGGQWQRVALARALFKVECGARLLILDEPTSALDVRAEADLYDQFLDITSGLTTVIVSHRFSTVRRADRIVVIDAGRIAEDGDHDTLMAADGLYATAFRLQADRLNLHTTGARS